MRAHPAIILSAVLTLTFSAFAQDVAPGGDGARKALSSPPERVGLTDRPNPKLKTILKTRPAKETKPAEQVEAPEADGQPVKKRVYEFHGVATQWVRYSDEPKRFLSLFSLFSPLTDVERTAPPPPPRTFVDPVTDDVPGWVFFGAGR